MANISDNLLVEIFEKGNDIESFFDAIFGFLTRCTNFYEGDVKMKEQILTNCFQKWRQTYDNVQIMENTEIADLDMHYDSKNDCQQIEFTSPAYSLNQQNFDDDTLANSDIHDPVYCNEIEITTTPEMMDSECDKSTFDDKKIFKSSPNKHCIKASDSYNGAVTDKYCWSQTITEVDIQICLPENSTGSNQVEVNITPTHLRVDMLSQCYLSEDLCWRCKPTESMWWISNGMLFIHLEKSKERWWEKLLITDDALDIKQMDCSRPIDELSEEAQNLVQEMFWNEQQKRMGKPTTDEIRKNEILKKCWNADGSPFKGTEFDPSLVKFQ